MKSVDSQTVWRGPFERSIGTAIGTTQLETPKFVSLNHVSAGGAAPALTLRFFEALEPSVTMSFVYAAFLETGKFFVVQP